LLGALGGLFGGGGGASQPAPRGRAQPRQAESMGAMIAKSVARNVAGQLGRDLGGAVLGKYGRSAGGALIRGVLGSLLKGR